MMPEERRKRRHSTNRQSGLLDRQSNSIRQIHTVPGKFAITTTITSSLLTRPNSQVRFVLCQQSGGLCDWRVIVQAVNRSFAFRRGFLSFWRPKGTRTRQPVTQKSLTESEKESIVTKRVPFGELFPFSEFRTTHGLTQNAESFRPRRLRFSASYSRTCGSWLKWREFSIHARRALDRPSLFPLLARTLALSV